MVRGQTTIYDMIENIVQVVFYTYYNYIKDPELKKDLFQIGYLKAYELLNNGNYDPTMSFRNFIYTGVRNEMHNALYHINKMQTVDLEALDKYDNVVGYHETGEYSIEVDDVRSICSNFSRYGDYFPSVVNYLIDIGIVDTPKLTEDRDSLNPKLLEGITTLVLWELFEKEKNNG